MLQPAIEILDAHRIMAVSTVRPDGWPQTTMVGYANDGWTLYFSIFRSSQKFQNIAREDRVSVAIAPEARSLGEIEAVYEIAAMRSKGAKLADIAAHLTASNVATRRGGKWSAEQVRSILERVKTHGLPQRPANAA